MDFMLFEDSERARLLPFTFTRPVFALRAGIYTVQERWEAHLAQSVYTYAYDYLGPKFSRLPNPDSPVRWVNGRYWPDDEFLRLVQSLVPGEFVYQEHSQDILAACFAMAQLPDTFIGQMDKAVVEEIGLRGQASSQMPRAFRFTPDIFRLNAAAIAQDIALIRKTQKSQPLTDPHTRVYGADNIFVSEGVKTRAAVINAEDGPVYLGPGVEIGEGALIHGSHAFGESAKVSMGAKLRGDSAFGPHCKVGGEVGNSVIMGYSNKGHEGYMGNSVLGYWCNLGADTNTSNLKNNYAEVKLWDYPSGRFRPTGLQFCGLMMGDHSKCGINTMFNTGTVVGVAANIFGAGYPRNFIPSFSWGGVSGFSTYQTRKVFEVAERVMQRRSIPFDGVEEAILEEVFAQTAPHRRWER